MKRINKTILFFLTLSLVTVCAQGPKHLKCTVKKTESTRTLKDSEGTHYISTLQIDSIAGDSVYTIITKKTTTTRVSGNTTETNVVSTSSKTVKKINPAED